MAVVWRIEEQSIVKLRTLAEWSSISDGHLCSQRMCERRKTERRLHCEDDWNELKLRKLGRWFGAPCDRPWCACECKWQSSWSDGLGRRRRRQVKCTWSFAQKATADSRWPSLGQTHLTLCLLTKQTTCLVKGHCPLLSPQEAINALSLWGVASVLLQSWPCPRRQMMVLCSRPSQLSIRWNVLPTATCTDNHIFNE